MEIKPLNIFYEEPEADRWIKFDRYPRRFIRRLIRGKQRPGGVMMVALELMRGLERLGVPYRFNDYNYIKKHPEELACIIGKAHLLLERQWPNPVLFGAGVFSHPVECPDLFNKYPNVKRILVPGEWMREMFKPYYGNKVQAWPTGIDTRKWKPTGLKKTVDFLIYDKVRWEHDHYHHSLILPIINQLESAKLSYEFIRYGRNTHNELQEKVACSKAVIFLCEHETQGQAYQQILSTDTPILAWDRGGYWRDPAYYPEIKFEPVSSVPYWSAKCGEQFKNVLDFENKLQLFLHNSQAGLYAPRSYILKNLTLEQSALGYLSIVNSIRENITNS